MILVDRISGAPDVAFTPTGVAKAASLPLFAAALVGGGRTAGERSRPDMSTTQTAALRIATRKSRLALAQTDLVAGLLARAGCRHVLVEITTKGDAVRDRSIAAIGGDGVFVKELEIALLEHRADIAVHSLKDLPTETHVGVDAGITIERADARDALLSRDNRYAGIETLPRGAVVGTSSLRRRSQLLAKRPDLDVRDLRGNVDTRVRAVLDGRYDAAVLAVAGMERIDLLDSVGGGTPLEPTSFVPAPGQGALFVQCREDDRRVAEVLSPLDHQPTATATAMERTFLRRMDGGCLAPIGAYAIVSGGRASMTAFVGSPRGDVWLRRTVECDVAESHSCAENIAEEMLSAGGREILALSRAEESKG
jgi:hydroxymethylbilane synthase